MNLRNSVSQSCVFAYEENWAQRGEAHCPDPAELGSGRAKTRTQAAYPQVPPLLLCQAACSLP